jgi:hypothetical protein
MIREQFWRGNARVDCRSATIKNDNQEKCLRTARLRPIMTSLPAATSNSDCRCRSHPDCRATRPGVSIWVRADGVAATVRIAQTTRDRTNTGTFHGCPTDKRRSCPIERAAGRRRQRPDCQCAHCSARTCSLGQAWICARAARRRRHSFRNHGCRQARTDSAPRARMTRPSHRKRNGPAPRIETKRGRQKVDHVGLLSDHRQLTLS